MKHDVRWFAWREVQEALEFGRQGGIALHYFRYDLRRFGLGKYDPCCHVISADRARLVTFAGSFGLHEFLLKRPRPQRPGIYHFDFFGRALQRLAAEHPPPIGILDEPSPAP
jgi:hypothetical protein